MRSTSSWHRPAITCMPRPSSSVSKSAISPFVARPPSELDASASTTRAPPRAAAIAAATPAVPPPTTSTSARVSTGSSRASSCSVAASLTSGARRTRHEREAVLPAVVPEPAEHAVGEAVLGAEHLVDARAQARVLQQLGAQRVLLLRRRARPRSRPRRCSRTSACRWCARSPRRRPRRPRPSSRAARRPRSWVSSSITSSSAKRVPARCLGVRLRRTGARGRAPARNGNHCSVMRRLEHSACARLDPVRRRAPCTGPRRGEKLAPPRTRSPRHVRARRPDR